MKEQARGNEDAGWRMGAEGSADAKDARMSWRRIAWQRGREKRGGAGICSRCHHHHHQLQHLRHRYHLRLTLRQAVARVGSPCSFSSCSSGAQFSVGPLLPVSISSFLCQASAILTITTITVTIKNIVWEPNTLFLLFFNLCRLSHVVQRELEGCLVAPA